MPTNILGEKARDLVVFTYADSLQCEHILPLFKPGPRVKVRLTTHMPHYNLRLVVTDEQAKECLEKLYPTAEVVIADLTQLSEAERVLTDAMSCYHEGPTSKNEEIIGDNMLKAAIKISKRDGIFHHFVYSSTLHPQLEENRVKLSLEQKLLESSLPFTILQPARFLDEISLTKLMKEKKDKGDLAVQTSWDEGSVASFVTLDDLAEVAGNVLQDADSHFGATYELVGVPKSTPEEICSMVGESIGETVKLATKSKLSSEEQAEKLDVKKARSEGNSNVLRSLLGRKPTTIKQWIEKELSRANEDDSI